MRRVYSLLLVVVLFVVMAAPAYAAESRGSSYGDDIVVWLCVSKNGNNQYASINGHAWLIVENHSFVDITVGTNANGTASVVIPSESIITIGGWMLEQTSSVGAAFLNGETGNTYSGAVALKVTIPSYSYYLLGEAILAAKNKFYYPAPTNGNTDYENAYTCVNFALEVWHAIGGATLNVNTVPKTAEALWELINNRTHYSYSSFSSLMSTSLTEIRIY